MPLPTGTRVGPYEILAPIGAGGMGEVYRAADARLNRDVALKVLPELFSKDAERMAHFEREAQVLASLNHPNIATLYGLEESGGIRALAMELVEGPTLAERISAGPIPINEALPIAKQIADALEYAHERGIVHRDLKPANLKLTAEGSVKVLDFGLAKALDDAPAGSNAANSPTISLASTRAGVILGTVAYMSPEQARGAAVDRRADIWAYGVVLYKMLTGRQLFGGATVSDTLAAVLTIEPDLKLAPAAMRPLLRRCLEKDPKQRLQAIGEARIALSDSTPETAPPQPPQRVLPWAVAAVLAAISFALGAFLWSAARPISHPLVRLNVDPGPEFAPTGSGASAILSPDGTRLVYTGRGPDGKVRLYTRPLGQEQAAPIPGTEDASEPFFSPDGQSVGFFAGGKLKKVSVLGGGAAVLCEAPRAVGGSWGDDGNIIAALNANSGLWRIPSGGGAPQPVTELKQEYTHRWPEVLPGAQAVLFTAHTTGLDFDGATIDVQSLRTGQRKTLARGGSYGRYASSGHLLYVRQNVLYAAPMDPGRLELNGPAAPVVEDVASQFYPGGVEVDVTRSGMLLYVKRQAARQTLVWLDSTGQTRPLRALAGECFGAPRFSPDGKRLAIGLVEGGNTDVWVYEWERDTMTRLTFTPGLDAWPVWSPDGKHIAFSSRRHGGAQNLYWMRADGAGEATRLTESNNVQLPSSFSPDGRRLAFVEVSAQTNYDLWTLPLDGVESGHPKAGKAEIFLQTPFANSAPMISPDGKWLAYRSNESGSEEVYVRRFPGPGGKWQISTGGGDWPVWSKKGSELFYRSREGVVMVASYRANGEAFVASKPRRWAEKKDVGQLFDLAPDGKRFAVVQEGASDQKGPQHVVFLLNFFDELRRRAPVERP